MTNIFNMELSQQIVSLDLAKQLKKLGVNQDSLFYWVQGLEISEFPNGDDYDSNYWKERVELINEGKVKHVKKLIKDQDREDRKMFPVYLYSAFTVAELGKLFGENFFIAFENLPFDRVSAVIYGVEGKTKGKIENPRINCKTEVEARAKALIYLIKNKLINPKESPCN